MKNKVIALLLCIITVMMPLCVSPAVAVRIEPGRAEENGLVIDIATGNIKYYSGSDYYSKTEMTIPKTVGGYDVKGLDEYAFGAMYAIAAFIVEDGHEYLSAVNGVLYNKSGDTLIKYPGGMPNESFTLPESVTKIARGSLSNATSLKELVLSKNVAVIEEDLSYLSIAAYTTSVDNPNFSSADGVLYNKDGSTLIRYPRGKNGEAFVVPESVTKIAKGSFDSNVELKELTLSKNVATVEQVFDYSLINTLIVVADNPYLCEFDGMLLDKNKTKVIACVVHKEEHLDDVCEYKKTIPDTVTEICNDAFSGCFKMSEIILPSGLLKIGDGAFSNCMQLCGTLKLPDGMLSIGEGAFAYTSFDSIIIPSSVNSIGDGAFFSGKHHGNGPFILRTVNNKYAENYANSNEILYINQDGGFYDPETTLLDRTQTSLEMSVDTSFSSGFVSFTFKYKTKPELAGKWGFFAIETIGELDYTSVYLNGSLYEGVFTEEETEKLQHFDIWGGPYVESNRIYIPMTFTDANSGELVFKTRLTESSVITTVATLNLLIPEGEEFSTRKETAGLINNSDSFLTLEADSYVGKPEIKISGLAPVASTVNIYADNIFIKTVTPSSTGLYTELLTLPSEGIHTVKVTAGDKEASKEVEYRSTAPNLTGFIMDYNGQTIDMLASWRPVITFSNMEKSFAFRINFDNYESITDVSVVSERNGIRKVMPAHKTQGAGAYIASGYFDMQNKGYVPGAISVEYVSGGKLHSLTRTVNRWAIDPSGYVYDVNEDSCIAGATAEIWYKAEYETPDEEAVIWADAADYNGQINTLKTDAEGNFAWDVPEGYWKVKVSKENYESCETDWLEVPPPQTNIGIQMKSTLKPEVVSFTISESGAIVVFNEYVCVGDAKEHLSLINNTAISNVTPADDKIIPTDEIAGSGEFDGKTYAKTFKLEGSFEKNSEYSLFISTDSIKTYSGIGCEMLDIVAVCTENKGFAVIPDYNFKLCETKTLYIETAGISDGATIQITTTDSIDYFDGIMTKTVNSGTVEFELTAVNTGKAELCFTCSEIPNDQVRVTVDITADQCDVDFNGKVNVLDAIMTAKAYMADTANEKYDFNGDGIVNAADIVDMIKDIGNKGKPGTDEDTELFVFDNQSGVHESNNRLYAVVHTTTGMRAIMISGVKGIMLDDCLKSATLFKKAQMINAVVSLLYKGKAYSAKLCDDGSYSMTLNESIYREAYSTDGVKFHEVTFNGGVSVDNPLVDVYNPDGVKTTLPQIKTDSNTVIVWFDKGSYAVETYTGIPADGTEFKIHYNSHIYIKTNAAGTATFIYMDNATRSFAG